MASTYSTRLRLELMGSGDQSGTWGTTTNTNLGTLIEAAIAGRAAVSMTDADYTLTVANGTTDEARNMILNISGALTATRNVICPAVSKMYIVKNATTGGQSIILKTSSGSGVTIENGLTSLVFCDGTNVVEGITRFPLTNPTIAGNALFSSAGARIQGDFSNATLANRTAFQDKTTNNETAVYALPNGTSNVSAYYVSNNSNPVNAAFGGFYISSTSFGLITGVNGSGTAIPMTFNTNNAEVGRFDTAGRFCVGVSTASALSGSVNAIGYASRSGTTGSFSGNAWNIHWTGSAAVLYMDTGSLGAINTTSDYRTKKNVVTQTANAVARINALRPVLYEIADAEMFKADGVTREGFIAHELAAVIPSAVEGVKDGLTSDGKIQPQTLRLDPIIAVLTKAVQELSARVAALEAK